MNDLQEQKFLPLDSPCENNHLPHESDVFYDQPITFAEALESTTEGRFSTWPDTTLFY
jgi:hypothetical protein